MMIGKAADHKPEHGAFLLPWLDLMRNESLHQEARTRIMSGEDGESAGWIYMGMASRALAIWHGRDRAVEAMKGVAADRVIELTAEQLAWSHYEIEILSGWVACTQDVFNIQVSPSRLARMQSEILLKADRNAVAVPETQTCIRFDGSKPPRLANGMPVDMLYVEPIKDQGKMRYTLLTPLGNGKHPRANGVSYLLDIDSIVETPLQALERAVDRLVGDVSRSKLVTSPVEDLKAHLLQDLPLAASLLVLATHVVEQASTVDTQIERGAPKEFRGVPLTDMIVERAMMQGWSEVTYLD